MLENFRVSLLLACILAVPFLAIEARAVDYVMAKIECPEQTFFRFNWKNNIGSDPTFLNVEELGVQQPRPLPFKRSNVSYTDNAFNCYYQHPQVQWIQTRYWYRAHRKILECTGMPGRVLECKMKKN